MAPAPSSLIPGTNRKQWTAWRIWSKHIFDQIETHIKSNHRMLSKLYLATMFREKLNLSDPAELSDTDVDPDAPLVKTKKNIWKKTANFNLLIAYLYLYLYFTFTFTMTEFT
jgi:hypothetical protein